MRFLAARTASPMASATSSSVPAGNWFARITPTPARSPPSPWRWQAPTRSCVRPRPRCSVHGSAPPRGTSNAAGVRQLRRRPWRRSRWPLSRARSSCAGPIEVPRPSSRPRPMSSERCRMPSLAPIRAKAEERRRCPDVPQGENRPMPEVRLRCGPVEYTDTGGNGPVVLLVGGLLIGPSVWKEVVTELRPEFRCIVPALPWGTHRQPMLPGTDLSLAGQARILAELVDDLRLDQVTLVENDTAMAQVLMAGHPESIVRVAFVSCETWSNNPPGLPGRSVALAAAVPGGLYLAMQQMRLRAFQRSPFAFGRMAKHGISQRMLDSGLRPAITHSGVRRDLA